MLMRWKRRKACLLVLCAIVGIGYSDTGIDPGFVNIKSAAVFTEDFKCH